MRFSILSEMEEKPPKNRVNGVEMKVCQMFLDSVILSCFIKSVKMSHTRRVLPDFAATPFQTQLQEDKVMDF